MRGKETNVTKTHRDVNSRRRKMKRKQTYTWARWKKRFHPGNANKRKKGLGGDPSESKSVVYLKKEREEARRENLKVAKQLGRDQIQTDSVQSLVSGEGSIQKTVQTTSASQIKRQGQRGEKKKKGGGGKKDRHRATRNSAWPSQRQKEQSL